MSVVDFSFLKRFGATIRDNLAIAGAHGGLKSPLAPRSAPGGAETHRDHVRGDSADVLDHETPRVERSSFLAPWTRRGATIDQLREGHDRVVRMMDALSGHFERQDRRSEQMIDSVVRMAGTLEKLAETQRQQGEFVQIIARGVDAAGLSTGSLAASLGQLPATLAAQTEALRGVVRQLEASQQTETQLAHSVQQVGLAVDALRAAGAMQVDSLQRLSSGDEQQRDALKAFIREQDRRFLWLLALVTTLGVVFIGALTWALLSIVGR